MMLILLYLIFLYLTYLTMVETGWIPFDPNWNWLEDSGVFSTHCSHTMNGTGDYGYRRYNHDRIIHEYIDLSDTLTARLVGVVDGMHGQFVPDTLAKVLGTALQVKFNQRLREPLANITLSLKENPPLISEIPRVINETMLYVDKLICDGYEPAKYEGASVSLALTIADFVFLVNLGDSRTVLMADGQLKYATAVQIREPLKPSQIKQMSSSLDSNNKKNPLKDETMLLNSLPVSHSFGHCKYKRKQSRGKYSMLTSWSSDRYDGVSGAVKATPDITIRRLYLHRGITYEIFSGTAGLFNVMEVNEIAYYLRMMQTQNYDDASSPICRNVVSHAHDRKQSDDVSAVYLKLTPLQLEENN